MATSVNFCCDCMFYRKYKIPAYCEHPENTYLCTISGSVKYRSGFPYVRLQFSSSGNEIETATFCKKWEPSRMYRFKKWGAKHRGEILYHVVIWSAAAAMIHVVFWW